MLTYRYVWSRFYRRFLSSSQHTGRFWIPSSIFLPGTAPRHLRAKFIPFPTQLRFSPPKWQIHLPIDNYRYLCIFFICLHSQPTVTLAIWTRFHFCLFVPRPQCFRMLRIPPLWAVLSLTSWPLAMASVVHFAAAGAAGGLGMLQTSAGDGAQPGKGAKEGLLKWWQLVADSEGRPTNPNMWLNT